MSRKAEKKLRVQRAQKLKREKSALISCILILVTAILIAGKFICHIPFKYSTWIEGQYIKELESSIIGTVGGVATTNDELSIEGISYKIVSGETYVTNQAEQKLKELDELKDLGILKTNSNMRDLWSMYYAYYAEEYKENIELFERLILWYSGLQTTNCEGYELHCNDDNCTFVTELSTIMTETADSIRNSNAHKVYHKQLEESAESISLTEDELKLAYETYILTNTNYIKSVTLDFALINNKLASEKQTANWALYGNENLVRWQLGDIRYSKTFNSLETIKTLSKYIDLTLDEQLLNSSILQYVPNTALMLGMDEDGFETDDTRIVNITGVENVEEWLLNFDTSKKLQSISMKNTKVDVGYANIFWSITNVQHIDNIPTYESLSQNSAWIKELKETVTEQTIWQML